MKQRFWVMIAFVICACGSEPIEEIIIEQSQGRIVGGAPTSAYEAVGALTSNGQMFCSATLIEKRKVLTAGHCIANGASNIAFVTGPKAHNPTQTMQVVSVHNHPQYRDDWFGIYNDIAYVTLAQDATVTPIPLVAQMDASWVGVDLEFVGYGVTNGITQAGGGTKRSVTMPISQMENTTFRYQTPGRNTCYGDSGGPALYLDNNGQPFVAGVTSWGDQNCTKFGVDTRVDTYLSFLNVNPNPNPPNPNPPNPNPPNPNPPPNGCNGETYVGRCDGDTVVWCENNQVHKTYCPARGRECGWAAHRGYYACVKADPCQGETYEGRCDGDVLIWCENQQVIKFDCGMMALSCGLDPYANFYVCTR